MASDSSNEMQKNNIFENLSCLDGDLLAHYGLNRTFEITIVGSSALIMLDVVSSNRRTTDIDVLEAPPEMVSFFDLYQMNTMVATFLFTYPETWQERKQVLAFSGDCLTVKTMSLEDLTILKLLAFRTRDQEDLVDIVKSGKLNWEQLEKLVKDPTELRINFDSEEKWLEFFDCYQWLLLKRQS